MAAGSQQAETASSHRRVGLLAGVGVLLVAAGFGWFLLRPADGTSYGDTNELVAAMEEAGVTCHWDPIGDERDDTLGNLDPERSSCWVGDSPREIGIEAGLDRLEVESKVRVSRENGSPFGRETLVAGPNWLLRIPQQTLPEAEARRLGDALGATDVVQITAAVGDEA